jgi:hypothetical protein
VIDGHPELFPHALELLALLAREAGHLERLSHQLATRVRPCLVALEGPPWP